MPQYLLDTDTLTLLRNGHPKVAGRAAQIDPDDIGTTVISVDEQIQGWQAKLRNAKTHPEIELAYSRLAETIRFFIDLEIVNYTVAAIGHFQVLKARKLNVGSNDLRIASIALVEAATVVTVNTRDFSRVKNLTYEDWTV